MGPLLHLTDKRPVATREILHLEEGRMQLAHWKGEGGMKIIIIVMQRLYRVTVSTKYEELLCV